MTLKTFNALDNAIAPPAEAGTPYHPGQLEAEIQQAMKELEEILK